MHEFCVHCKGIWSKLKFLPGFGMVAVNTGMIDSIWAQIKGYIPRVLPASREILQDYLYSWWLRRSNPDVDSRIRIVTAFLLDGAAGAKQFEVGAE